MPEEQHELRRINWSECFGFTQLFRSFRLAIHPSKLLLALIAVLVLYGAGRLMDGVWGPRVVVDISAPEQGPRTELEAFAELPREAFVQWRRDVRERNIAADARLAAELLEGLRGQRQRAQQAARAGQVPGRIERQLQRKLDDALDVLRRRLGATLEIRRKQIESMTGQQKRQAEEAFPDYERALGRAHDALVILLSRGSRHVPAHLPVAGALEKLLQPNVNLTEPKAKQDDARRLSEDRAILNEALSLRSGLDEALARRGDYIFDTLLRHSIASFGLGVRSVLAAKLWIDDRPEELPGLVGSIKKGLLGLVWLVRAHWLFAIIYLAICLVVWAIIGGAICRIAALHAARDEKISLKEALKFSLNKFVSFLTAPLIPLVLIVVIGLVTLAGGLVGLIPVVGELLAGVLWFLALLAGFIMALVAIGAAGGLHLMYPTIAVEGSDAFDAISRSYSYVYSRPWRTGWYLLVAIAYGTVCLLFVKVVAFLLLKLAHIAAGLGMNLGGAARLATVGKLDAIWSAPIWGERLFGGFWDVPMRWSEQIAAVLIAIYVFLVVGAVVAFAFSFFFSASTVMYLLLRREVDATDLEDVYVEEAEEEAEAAPPPPEEKPPEEAPKPPEPEGPKPEEPKGEPETRPGEPPAPAGGSQPTGPAQ